MILTSVILACASGGMVISFFTVMRSSILLEVVVFRGSGNGTALRFENSDAQNLCAASVSSDKQ